MSSHITTLTASLLLIAAIAWAADFETSPDDLLGVWQTADEGDSRSLVEIYMVNDRYHGRIIHLDSPIYPIDSEDGPPGQPRTDRNNPDESLRDRPILGLDFMHSFKFHKGKWKDGRIYDPNNGKEYRCKLTLKDRDTLEVFGYVKIGFIKLGRDTAWTRFNEE